MMMELFKRLIFIYLLAIAAPCSATDWYVDNAASGNNDGTGWTDAWVSFADITWGGEGVVAGDTLYISGGSSTKTYDETLTIGASGTDGNLIYIKPGSQDSSPSGHDGTVIISSSTAHGVFNSQAYTELNGNDGNGNIDIKIKDCDDHGIWATVSAAADHHQYYKYLWVEGNGDEQTNSDYGIKLIMGTDDFEAEIAYCYFKDNYRDAINVDTAGSCPAKHDRLLIHDNEFESTHDDVYESASCGTSFYNNYIHDLSTDNTEAGNHPDGFVSNGGAYLKIYNNIIANNIISENCFSSAILVSGAVVSGWATEYVYVYNNLIYEDASSVTTCEGGSHTGRGIEVTDGNWGGASYGADFYIVNNTIVNYPYYAMSFTQGDWPTVDDFFFLNNVVVNCGRNLSGSNYGFMLFNNAAYTVGSYGDGTNVEMDYNLAYAGTNGESGIYYKTGAVTYANISSSTNMQDSGVSEQDPSLDSNYRPDASDDPIVDVGVNLNGVFTTDLDGNTRSGTWDIGAYGYGAGSSSPTLTGGTCYGCTMQ
jgi:hypothetical protein